MLYAQSRGQSFETATRETDLYDEADGTCESK